MNEINKTFEKQVMKLTHSSYAIIIPKKIVDEFGIESGDVLIGVFKFLQKHKSAKNTESQAI
jgi:hypothetical protein